MFLVCGEALFDFFLESETGPSSATYAARAGGSPFNVAVGLARLGVVSGLLTGLSTDLLGARLGQVLADEGVSTRYCVPTDRPTTLSLVGLDAAGVPAYQFYGRGSADIGLKAEDLRLPGDEVVGLHFGSYSIAAAPAADAMARLALMDDRLFVTLDPNVRLNVEPDLDIWRERLAVLASRADVVKVSAEDLDLLRPGAAHGNVAADFIAQGVSLVVITDGGGAARAWAIGGVEASAVPPAVTVVDTVGAGDTFQAVLIERLLASPEGPRAAARGMDGDRLGAILARCARAAAITCSRRGADLPRAAELEEQG
jgi:fructokinase